jgi:hypothetical protein
MEAEPELELIACPECGLPAEVTGSFTLGSTHGEVEHLVTIGVGGHWLTPRRETLPSATEVGPRTLLPRRLIAPRRRGRTDR